MSPSRLYIQLKFWDNVFSIRDVICLRILEMTLPELETGGKFKKCGNSAMFGKKFSVVMKIFVTFWDKTIQQQKKRKKQQQKKHREVKL